MISFEQVSRRVYFAVSRVLKFMKTLHFKLYFYAAFFNVCTVLFELCHNNYILFLQFLDSSSESHECIAHVQYSELWLNIKSVRNRYSSCFVYKQTHLLATHAYSEREGFNTACTRPRLLVYSNFSFIV